MKNMKLSTVRLAALSAAIGLSACGGGGGSVSMSNASAANARYSQTMTITFTGQGFDAGVDARVEGPCSSLTRQPNGAATGVQFSCVVTGVGRITASLVSPDGGQTYGSVKVDIPLPQVSLTVTDGTRTGNLLLELDPVAAPVTVGQFMAYANAGFYTTTVFHRVRPDTAILGGGYTATTDGGLSAKAPTRSAIALEKTGLKNVRGTLAMHRDADVNSANSMFFINVVDNPRFDVGSTETPDGYAVFGKVIEGIDVVDTISKVPVRPDLALGVNDVPVTAVRISAVGQTR